MKTVAFASWLKKNGEWVSRGGPWGVIGVVRGGLGMTLEDSGGLQGVFREVFRVSLG